MRFDYLAIDSTGTRKSGAEEAVSEPEAVASLLRRGLTPLELQPAAAARPSAARRSPFASLRRQGRGRSAQAQVIRELAALLRASVTLEESLRTLIESRADAGLEAVLTRVLSQVLAGERFSAALQAQTDAKALALPSYVIALVSAGESTGDLAGALTRAAEQLEFDEQLGAETTEALIYPMILVAAGTGAVLFVFSFVVPRFSTLLAGRNADLPWLSSAVLGVGEFVNRHGTLIGIVLAGAVGAGVLGWRALGPARVRGALARLPLFGAWIRQQELSRWTGMLALMLQSRVPILAAIDLASRAVTLDEVGRRLRLAMGDIGRGEALSRTLAEHSLLPSSALSMRRCTRWSTTATRRCSSRCSVTRPTSA